MDILTWSYCHSVDVIALYSGDGDYAEAARRARYCCWIQLIIQKAPSDGSNCPGPGRKWSCVSSESRGTRFFPRSPLIFVC
jgi:hypothetical protein